MSIDGLFHSLRLLFRHLALLFVHCGLSQGGGFCPGLLTVEDGVCGQLIGGCARTDLSSSSASLWSVLELDSMDQSHKSCPTLCGPMDCSPPGFSFHGIL